MEFTIKTYNAAIKRAEKRMDLAFKRGHLIEHVHQGHIREAIHQRYYRQNPRPFWPAWLFQ